MKNASESKETPKKLMQLFFSKGNKLLANFRFGVVLGNLPPSQKKRGTGV